MGAAMKRFCLLTNVLLVLSCSGDELIINFDTSALESSEVDRVNLFLVASKGAEALGECVTNARSYDREGGELSIPPFTVYFNSDWRCVALRVIAMTDAEESFRMEELFCPSFGEGSETASETVIFDLQCLDQGPCADNGVCTIVGDHDTGEGTECQISAALPFFQLENCDATAD